MIPRAIALVVCRLYTVLPCTITVLATGALAALPYGKLGALALVLGCALARLFGMARGPGGLGVVGLNAALYGAVLLVAASSPDSSLPIRLAWGLSVGLLATASLVSLAPKLDPLSGGRLQLELFPDLLTGILLVVLFAAPVRLYAVWRRFRGPRWPVEVRPPFRVSVIVASHQEAKTIERCLESIARSADRARSSPWIADIRIVLADSCSTDGTVELAARYADLVLPCPMGKLNARHHAIVHEAADVIVAADADRAYPESWLLSLIAPLGENPEIAAVTGETRAVGRPPSGSAFTRRWLHMPYNGGNSAFLREAYLREPPNLSIDQFSHKALFCEEEFRFPLGLALSGPIVYVPCYSEELRPYPLAEQLRRQLFGLRLRTF